MMDKKKRGMSLTEITVGIAIIVVVGTAALVALRNFMKANITRFNYDRIGEALNYWHGIIRFESGYRFDTMQENWTDKTHTASAYNANQPHKNYVTVFSSISALINGANIRKVNLEAQWMDHGVLNKRQMDFTITYSRAKVAGGLIRMRFVDNVVPGDPMHVDNHPLLGVRVRAPGMDGAITQCESISDGTCDLYDVLVSSPPAGVQVLINSRPAVYNSTAVGVGYYFDVGEPAVGGAIASVGPTVSPSYERSVNTTIVRAAPKITDIGTFQINAPGQIRVTVRDADTNAPLPNIRIHLVVPDVNRLKIAEALPFDQGFRMTDANGEALFASLIPSLTNTNSHKSHAVYAVGNGEWAGIAWPSDSGTNIPVQTVLSRPLGDPPTSFTAFNFRLLRRGSIRGTVTGVHYNNSGPGVFTPTNNHPANPMKVMVVRRNERVFHPSVTTPANHSINLLTTEGWKYWGRHNPPPDLDVEGDDWGYSAPISFPFSGVYLGFQCTPKMLYRAYGPMPPLALNEQYNLAFVTLPVDVNKNFITDYPFMPVIVVQPGNRATNAKLGVPFNSFNGYNLWVLPDQKGTDSTDDYKVKVYANSTLHPNAAQVDLLLLERGTNDTSNSPLGNIHGDIFDHAGLGNMLFNPNKYNMNPAKVMIDSNDNGGFVVVHPFTNQSYIDQTQLTRTAQYSLSVDTNNPVASHNYTFMGPNTKYGLIPNVGANQIHLRVKAETWWMWDYSTPYQITVNAWRRIKDVNGDIVMSTVTTGYWLKVKALSETWHPMWGYENVFVSNMGGNPPTMQINLPAFSNHPNEYVNWITESQDHPATVDPGVDKYVPIWVNGNDVKTRHYNMYYQIDNGSNINGDVYFPDKWFSTSKKAGVHTGTWNLVLQGRTGKIYGKVTDINGTPMPGLLVELKMAGFSTFRTFTTVNSASMPVNTRCGDSALPAGFQYVFDDVPFFPVSTVNMEIRVNDATAKNYMPPYQGTSFKQNDAYECIEWRWDFPLSPVVIPPLAQNP